MKRGGGEGCRALGSVGFWERLRIVCPSMNFTTTFFPPLLGKGWGIKRRTSQLFMDLGPDFFPCLFMDLEHCFFPRLFLDLEHYFFPRPFMDLEHCFFPRPFMDLKHYFFPCPFMDLEHDFPHVLYCVQDEGVGGDSGERTTVVGRGAR
jgi:hypothetical protein